MLRNKLAIILFASFLLSLSYSLYYRIEPAVDARAYDNIGWNLAEGNGFREVVSGDIQYDFAIGRVGPLYQYFLAGVYKIFGHNYFMVWFLQAVLHALSAFLIYKICLMIFDQNDNKENISLIAAAIFGFHPDLVEISAMLMTETLYLFLFCLMLYAFAKLFEDRSYLNAALLGIISGAATLARPPVLFCLPIVLFYFYNKKLFREMAIFFAMLCLVFVPWTASNYSVYGKIMPFGVAGQYNFWIGNHPGSTGAQEAGSEIMDFINTHPTAELGDESMRQFKSFVFSHPIDFARVTILRINRYFSIIRPMGFWFYTSGWRQILFVACSALYGIFLFILGLAGAVKMFGEKNERYIYLLAFAAVTPLILFITVVETRYRFQIYPLLAIFAGYFIATFRREDLHARKILTYVALLIFLNGGFDLLLSSAKLLERVRGWM